MHSSRMRTGRSLTVCWSLLPGGGVCSAGVSAPEGSAPGGSVADPGFARGGGANSPGGVPTYDFAKFFQKLHEIERIWAPRGGRVSLHPPLDPPHVCSWGVSAPGGLLPVGGLLLGGVCSWGGIPACTEADPPVNRMTDRCKNITLATTSLRPVKKLELHKKVSKKGSLSLGLRYLNSIFIVF